MAMDSETDSAFSLCLGLVLGEEIFLDVLKIMAAYLIM